MYNLYGRNEPQSILQEFWTTTKDINFYDDELIARFRIRVFFDPYCPKSKLLCLYGKTRVRENPYSDIICESFIIRTYRNRKAWLQISLTLKGFFSSFFKNGVYETFFYVALLNVKPDHDEVKASCSLQSKQRTFLVQLLEISTK